MEDQTKDISGRVLGVVQKTDENLHNGHIIFAAGSTKETTLIVSFRDVEGFTLKPFQVVSFTATKELVGWQAWAVKVVTRCEG